MRPPWQPWFPSAAEQSTSCCSESDTSFPVSMATAPSVEPVVEKAQHEPHDAWFFTGVTAFLVRQSTPSAFSLIFLSLSGLVSRVRLNVQPPIPTTLLNSSHSRSENSLPPMRQFSSPSSARLLCSLMISTFLRYTAVRLRLTEPPIARRPARLGC